jgi:acyl-homoserine lactone acylase PvdQ
MRAGLRTGFLAAVVFSIGFSSPTAAADVESLTLPGLAEPVEILVDRWGVPHIYAKNEADLFFAQGFYAARDRTFQFEMWRRQATGTLAEIQGSRHARLRLNPDWSWDLESGAASPLGRLPAGRRPLGSS